MDPQRILEVFKRRRLTAEETNNTAVNSKHFNNSCFYCQAGFTFLFNQKHCCFQCQQFVCRKCVTWDLDTKDWACISCWKMISDGPEEWSEKSTVNCETEVDSENDSGYHPLGPKLLRESPRMTQDRLLSPSSSATFSDDSILISDGGEIERSVLIRNKIEHIVEYLLEKQLEDIPVSQIYRGQAYDDFIVQYKDKLFLSVKNLREALTTSNREDLKRFNEAKSILKDLLHEMKCKSRLSLPLLQREVDDNITVQSCLSFEESLTNVILNKIVIDAQNLISTLAECDKFSKEIQTDEWESEVEGKLDKQRGLSSSVDIGIQSDIGVDDVDLTTDDGAETSSESSRSCLMESNGVLSDSYEPQLPPYIVEEKIEEITTTYETESEGSDGEKRAKPSTKETVVATQYNNTNRTPLDYVYPTLDFEERYRVPFPELGMDVTEGAFDSSDIDSESNENQMSSCYPVTLNNWEDNWLFKSGKNLPTYLLGSESQPLGMFVPLPDADVTVRVGDKDIDELSELSERHSIGSYDLSSDEQDNAGISLESEEVSIQIKQLSGDIIEFSQKDHEYTEDYASLAYRVQSPPCPGETPSLRHSSPKTVEAIVGKVIPESPSSLDNTRTTDCSNVETSDTPSAFTPVKASDVKLSFKTTCVLRPSPSSKPRPLSTPNLGLYSNEEKETIKRFVLNSEINELGLVIPSYCPITRRKLPKGDIKFTEVPNDVVTHVGKSVHLTCRIEGESPICIPGQDISPSFLEPPSVSNLVGKNFVEISFRIAGCPEPCVELYEDSELILPSKTVDISYIDTHGRVIVTLHDPKEITRYHIVLRNKSGSVRHNLGTNNQNYSNIECVERTEHIVLKDVKPSIITSSLSQKKESREEDVFQPIGIIAAREHKKWENPVSMANNPYSAENLMKRMNSRSGLLDSILSGSAQALDKINERGELMKETGPAVINCGLKSIDSSRYRRDYYVNESLRLRDRRNNSRSLECLSTIKPDLIHTTVEKHHNCSNFLNMNTNGINHAEHGNNNCDEDPVSLPSVKSLAEKFKTSEEPSIPPIKEEKVLKASDILENANIIVVPKNTEELSIRKENARKYKEVHSLTARSVPREFREAVKQNYPKQPNRNIQAPPDLLRGSPIKTERKDFNIENFSKMKIEENSNQRNAPSPEHLGIPHSPAQITARGNSLSEGYTSDESITCSTAVRQPRKHPRKKSKSIASRAAFWDNRVKNGLVSDHTVIEEFPNMIPSES